jgi:hypothetical protein
LGSFIERDGDVDIALLLLVTANEREIAEGAVTGWILPALSSVKERAKDVDMVLLLVDERVEDESEKKDPNDLQRMEKKESVRG